MEGTGRRVAGSKVRAHEMGDSMADAKSTKTTKSTETAKTAEGIGEAGASKTAGLPARPGGIRILARGEYVPNDTWVTRLNNNDLVVGPTGAGKTRGYVKPNILQMNESMVVTDTKGSLCEEVGPVLRENGYRVLAIDFSGGSSGCGYNPLDFIHWDRHARGYSERDIMRVATALCPVESEREPFWDHAARMYIACLIGFVMDELPARHHTLADVLELVSGLQTRQTDALLDAYACERPDKFAARKWRSFRATKEAGRMHASILGIIAEKLDTLTYDGAAEIYRRRERVRFARLGMEKTAVFLKVSDTDRSADRIVALFYAQALQELTGYADTQCPGHALRVPVRLYLDDFAANCRIPDFDKIVSVIRSRNIAVSVVLQSITQLETLYGHAEAMTIVNGCDHLLYLGGQDVETAEFIGKKAHCMADTILDQGVDEVWLFERGSRPRRVEAFALEEHERYHELPEAQLTIADPTI